MKVRVPMMIQDPLTSRYKGMENTEEFFIDREDFFLDGPVTRRVAVLDFDPRSGTLLSGAAFLPPKGERTVGRYHVADEGDIHARDFNQVSVFATVLRTMYMFEEEDALGRPLVWAFDAPQLLVIPRAGEWANAYYERESHSLQFYYFPVHPSSGEMIYTSLSRDIIAHETGHAILDGIAPDLYNAVTPQSLALHEAIADLTALMMAFSSHNLRQTVLSQTGGYISNSTAFSAIAEEFGRVLSQESRATFYLRTLLNNKTLDPADTSLDERGRPNCVARNDPYALSEVLSGALYTVIINIHESLKRREAAERGESEYSVSGRALAIGAERFKRMIFRALDYLPPGEVSFADYGRAIIAADQASHPDPSKERDWLCEEFVRRRMAPDRQSLEVATNLAEPALQDLNLETFVESDWAAYEFANRNRELLGIPRGIPFRVRPRLDVTKLYYTREGKKKIRECIFKVSWERTESNTLSKPFPAKRQITVGTTLAIDWETRALRAKLTSDLSDEQKHDRDLMLRHLTDQGFLQLERQAIGPDGKELRSVVIAEAASGLMRVRGVARMLPIIEAANGHRKEA